MIAMGQEGEKFYFNEPMSTLGISVLEGRQPPP